jgi:hypothetical protein
MSTALAIASVTYVLKDLLNNGLIDANISDATKGAVSVTALPPDLIDLTDSNHHSRLNLYMYQVIPNQGWRNTGFPSHDSNGQRTSNPPLALDLHYFLTAYAFNELHSEILLGYGMQLLHETPVLARDAIKKSLNATTATDGSGTAGGSLPDALKTLSTSALAEQVEQIKISPVTMNTDEMSKLWSAFQSKYRPTAAYSVSVVLIESTKSARSPMPVLTRGKPAASHSGEEGIHVVADITRPVPSIPILIETVYPDKQKSALTGERIDVSGFNLDGGKIIIHFENKWFDTPHQIELPNGQSGTVSFTIPESPSVQDPLTTLDMSKYYPAGLYYIFASISYSGKPSPSTTNKIPFALAPEIMPISNLSVSGNSISLKIKPLLWPGQRVSLFVNDREIIAEPITTITDTATFKLLKAAEDGALLHVRVDDVDSHFIDYTKHPPEFCGQRVIIS